MTPSAIAVDEVQERCLEQLKELRSLHHSVDYDLKTPLSATREFVSLLLMKLVAQ
jgi:hypothetical protein